MLQKTTGSNLQQNKGFFNYPGKYSLIKTKSARYKNTGRFTIKFIVIF
jgi:hypothetical protein